jgi:hypothetical protein
MANTVTKQELGAFAAGAIPPPFEHTFKDFTGAVVDISSFATLQMNIAAIPSVTGPLGGGSIAFTTDGTDGKVTYFWSATDMAEASDYEAQMWVSNGSTQKYESDLLTYRVYDGPGSAP